MADLEFEKGPGKNIVKIREDVKKPEDLLKQIGALGVAEAQFAFQSGGLGDISWPVRYPGQPDPFINIAGVVQDFKSGRRSPKPNRFSRTPPLIDEGKRGGIWGSLTWDVSGSQEVKWGSPKTYASIHQEGLESMQTVTPDVKKRMMDYFYTKESGQRDAFATPKPKIPKPPRRRVVRHNVYIKYPGREWTLAYTTRSRQKIANERRNAKSGNYKVRTETEYSTSAPPPPVARMGGANRRKRFEFLDKFGWLLNRKNMDKSDILTTSVNKRPFLGITDTLQEDIQKTVKEHFDRLQRG
jgi:hypothetical protein